MIKTGIMGGTFDPIHHGHLFLAKEVMAIYELDRILFVPTKIGPHKIHERHTDSQLRLEMVKHAIKDEPKFEYSDMELRRTGLSYTIDTVNELLTDKIHDELYFITGADAILKIESWKSYKELLHKVIFIAATRPSHDEVYFEKEVKRLNDAYDARIYFVDILGLEISSSDIRTRIKTGKPVSYLLPKCVEQMILEHGLYVD